MKNYEFSPQELKIIVDIANKHKIPISLGNDTITVHSKYDFKPLMAFSIKGLDVKANIVDYRKEVEEYLKIFMEEKVTIK